MPPLFVEDDELRDLIAPHVGKDRFAATVRDLELKGFPPRTALFRARYFPAVKA